MVQHFPSLLMMTWFTKAVATVEVEPQPEVNPEQRYLQLPSLIDAADKELQAVLLDEVKYRATHPGNEKIINMRYLVSVGSFSGCGTIHSDMRTAPANIRLLAVLSLPMSRCWRL